MAEELNNFTHIGVKKSTHRKVSILARVLDNTDIYSLVEFWANTEWENARSAGLVTDAMLEKNSKNVSVKTQSGLPVQSVQKSLKIAQNKSGGRLAREKALSEVSA